MYWLNTDFLSSWSHCLAFPSVLCIAKLFPKPMCSCNLTYLYCVLCNFKNLLCCQAIKVFCFVIQTKFFDAMEDAAALDSTFRWLWQLFGICASTWMSSLRKLHYVKQGRCLPIALAAVQPKLRAWFVASNKGMNICDFYRLLKFHQGNFYILFFHLQSAFRLISCWPGWILKKNEFMLNSCWKTCGFHFY